MSTILIDGELLQPMISFDQMTYRTIASQLSAMEWRRTTSDNASTAKRKSFAIPDPGASVDVVLWG